MTDRKTFNLWLSQFQDEADAAFLYRLLARQEKDSKRAKLYEHLAEIEDRHVNLWAELLRRCGQALPRRGPSLRARALGWLCSRMGPAPLLSLLLAEEGREVKKYLNLSQVGSNPSTRDAARSMARESAEHWTSLSDLIGAVGEPWHRVSSGGFLRNVVYGFNDGLTANFGWIAGVIGAAVEPKLVVVSGIAGLLADSLSMGASGYLAAKSQQEVYSHEIELERQEIDQIPELEEEEMALIYQARGMEPRQARRAAAELMRHPQQALAEKVREELKISPAAMSPPREGLVTGLATAIGALIPVAPFFFLPATPAIWASFAVSMASHFAVGAARSLFTGRSLLRSGGDMFAVGLGVAVLGYLVGDLVTSLF